MVRRYLGSTLLACLLAVTALGVAEESLEAEYSPPSNILTISTGVPPYLDIAYGRINWSLLGLEGGVGARLVVDPENASLVSLTPFVVFGYYAKRHAIWLEVQTPEGIVPLIGDDPQVFNLGGEYRW